MTPAVTETSPFPIKPFLSPRFWPTWSALGLLWGVSCLPHAIQLGLGRQLGRGLMRLAPRRRRIAAINLQLCFPEFSDADRNALLARHFESLGMGMMEVAMTWWAPDRQLRPLGRIEGLQHLHQALSQGRGVLLLSAHFTSLEMGACLLTWEVPFYALYREHKNPLFQAVMHRGRERHAEKVIPHYDMRAMLRSLRENKAVWYAPDQNYGLKYSVFAPFFGISAATNTATSRLARASGAPVIPFFTRRLPQGGYLLTLYPPLSDFPSDDVAQDAARINRMIEDEVRKAPEQYLWVHRRFKDRPGMEQRFY